MDQLCSEKQFAAVGKRFAVVVMMMMLVGCGGGGGSSGSANAASTNGTPGAGPAPPITPATGAQAYYVDPSGSDSNSGSSSSSAWQSVAKVNSANLRPGDVVYFKRGGVWRGALVPQNGSSGSPISYTSYGTGTQPIITGADLVPDSGWSSAGGSVYQVNLSNSPSRIYDVYVDGGAGSASSNAFGTDPMWGLMSASCLPGQGCGASSTYLGEMQRGSWMYSNPTLYVWLGDNSNPNSGGHTIEIVTRQSCVGGDNSNTVNPSHIVLSDLRLQRCAEGVYFYASGVDAATDQTFQYLTVTQTGTGQVDDGQYLNGIHVEGGSNEVYTHNVISYTGNHGNGINNQRSDNVMISYNDVSHFDHHGIDNKASDNVTVTNNVVHDGILAPGNSAFGGSVNDHDLNGIYSESQSDNGRGGSGASGSYPAANFVVEKNTITNVGIGGGDGTGLGIQFDHYLGSGNKADNNTISKVQVGIGAITGSGEIVNNTITQTTKQDVSNGAGYNQN